MKGSTAYDGACECGGLIEMDDHDRTLADEATKEHHDSLSLGSNASE
jgi:hypothetical protein